MRKKLLPLAIAVIAASTLLSGCAAQRTSVTVNEDGSGSIIFKAGYLKESIESMIREAEARQASYQGPHGHTTADDSPVLSTDALQEFNLDGTDYLGHVYSGVFSSPEKMFSCLDEMALGTQISTEGANFQTNYEYNGIQSSLRKSGDGFVLEVDVRETGMNEEYIEFYTTSSETAAFLESVPEYDSELSDNVFASIGFDVQYDFTFPYEIIQTEGQTAGTIIHGNSLVIDFTKLKRVPRVENYLVFSIGDTDYAKIPSFIDVSADAWYYRAIRRLAEGKLVSGYGTGEFGPNDKLTVVQMAQLICNATGLPTGSDSSGYWAAQAILNCIQRGYISSRGITVPENYDIPITREEAVAAMSRAFESAQKSEAEPESETVDNFDAKSEAHLLPSYIPDYLDISSQYLNDVIHAYETGITRGVDDVHTFLPQGLLTRAEACQLFYNVGWTLPAQTA